MDITLREDDDVCILDCFTQLRRFNLYIGETPVADGDDSTEIELVPGVDFYFKNNDLPLMLKLTTEMDVTSVKPKMYLAPQVRQTDLAIYFELFVNDLSFLDGALHPALIENFERTANGRPFQVTALHGGHVEHSTIFTSFMELFEERRCLKLRIAEENPEAPMQTIPHWTSIITFYEPLIPRIF
ncbi:MAG TPA: hypothetical protein VJC11_01140 [Patescibacteria group bacterium]|nr:hypothetical protein [Patescibacteria group bacterium]